MKNVCIQMVLVRSNHSLVVGSPYVQVRAGSFVCVLICMFRAALCMLLFDLCVLSALFQRFAILSCCSAFDSDLRTPPVRLSACIPVLLFRRCFMMTLAGRSMASMDGVSFSMKKRFMACVCVCVAVGEGHFEYRCSRPDVLRVQKNTEERFACFTLWLVLNLMQWHWCIVLAHVRGVE